jgi:hypothetical protein
MDPSAAEDEDGFFIDAAIDKTVGKRKISESQNKKN